MSFPLDWTPENAVTSTEVSKKERVETAELPAGRVIIKERERHTVSQVTQSNEITKGLEVGN